MTPGSNNRVTKKQKDNYSLKLIYLFLVKYFSDNLRK